MKGKRSSQKKSKQPKEKRAAAAATTSIVSPTLPAKLNLKLILSILVVFVAVLVAAAGTIVQKQPVQESKAEDHTGGTPTAATIQVGQDQAQAHLAARTAQEDPYSVPKATAAAEAFLVEGDVFKSSQWSAFAFRRQAIHAGATPEQAYATSKYRLIHFVQQLEANLVFLSKVILQEGAGVRYVQQLEQHCGANSTATSDALSKDPSTVHREQVQSLLVQCMLNDNLLDRLRDGSKYTRKLKGGWNIWHFLAYMGSHELLEQALVSFSSSNNNKSGIVKTDPWGRTPAKIAELKGFSSAADLLLSVSREIDSKTAATTTTKRGLTATTMIPTDDVGDNGGWGTSISTSVTGPLSQEIKCDIPVVEDGTKLTYKEFVTEFMAQERPVLLRNGASPTFLQIQQMMSQRSFHENFGLMPITKGSVPYQGQEQMTVHEFLEQFSTTTTTTTKSSRSDGAPYYFFESLPVGHPLRQGIESHFPDYAHGGHSLPEERQVQLSIGPAGSGAPPHFHKAAINTLFYGQKKWFLYPPKDAVYTSLSMKQWLLERKDADDGGLECIQQAGDVLFVPDFWGHATLNMLPSVAVASEFITPRMDFDMVL